MKNKLIYFLITVFLASVAYSANVRQVQLKTNSTFRCAFSVDSTQYMPSTPFLASNCSVASNDYVAEVDGYRYLTIQSAIDVAVNRGSAIVDIVKSVVISNTLSIVGKGIEETNVKLNINSDVVVTFADREIPGIMIDNATVEFVGDGTWFKFSNDPDYPTKTMVCVGERSIDCELAPANVIVTSGVFDCGHSNAFRVKNGLIIVNGGTFKIRLGTTRYCVLAERSDVKDCLGNVIPRGLAEVKINGGTFITPMASTLPPCAVKAK